MIDVFIMNNGDIKMRCTTCSITDTVDFALKRSPFWETYVGWHLLGMIQHAMDCHK